MNKAKSFTPFVAPFPAPRGYFDFSRVCRAAGRTSPHGLERGGRVELGASSAEIIKSIVYALLVAARRTVIIDIDGACNLSVFNGADFLAAYTVESVAEANATLTALVDELQNNPKIVSSDLNIVITDLNRKLSREFTDSCVELSECFGARVFVCADFSFGVLSVIGERDVRIIGDDEISRAVTRYSVNRV